MSAALLTPEQLAERLGMEWPSQKGWIYARSREWISSDGQRGIPTVKLGRYYRYRADAVERWTRQLESGEVEA